MEKKILHLLIIDDSPDDADLPVSALRKHGYMLKTARVQDKAAMQAALGKGDWEVIIAKHSIPHFGAQQALDTLKSLRRELPLVVFSDTISDEEIAKVMHAGARDVVLKDDLGRLAPAVERELAVVRERDQYRQESKRLEEVEGKHQAMIDGSLEAICYSHEGMHVDANRAYLRLFGYDNMEELEGVPVLDLIEKSDHDRFKEYLRKVTKKSQKSEESQEFLALRKDGTELPVEVILSLIDIGGESCTQIVVNDASRRGAPVTDTDNNHQRDSLTGAYRREHFLRELGKAVDQAKAGGKGNALLYVEFDGLKEVNETLGHDRGDQLLREIGKRFKSTLDKEALLSRFGGDEFAVLLPHASHEKAQRITDDLTRCVADAAAQVGVQGKSANCTIGLIMIDRTAGSVEKILSLAYGACEQAKKRKKPIPTATPIKDEDKGTTESESQDDQWRERIERALQHDTFQLVYQPVINLIGDPSEYYEVLIRMAGEGDELVSAGEFMPLAERYGLVRAIDHWVMERALNGLAELHKDGQEASFFINVSTNA
ncbi:MAG: diguanylate cyclase domain-containing protein, partial [Acidiferrobacterales bacterium]